MPGLSIMIAILIVLVFAFILFIKQNKVIATIVGIFLVAGIAFLVLSILEHYNIINIGVTKINKTVDDFYVKNGIYFQLGYGIIVIILGAALLFSTLSLGKGYTILGIFLLALGIFYVIAIVLGLQGVEWFAKYFLAKTTTESEATSEAAKLIFMLL